MNAVLQPLSGFQQLMPEEQELFDKMIDTIRSTYRMCGFVPLETPAVERKETLLAAKGGIANQVYALTRLQGEQEYEAAVTNSDVPVSRLMQLVSAMQTAMALRFDLTVPMARFVAANYRKLSFPFRRFQIQPVWRGERAQAGRYRQFMQCDIDIIGMDVLSPVYDAEVPTVIARVLRNLGITNFVVHISNMKILRGVLQELGARADEQTTAMLRCIDNAEKVGKHPTVQCLAATKVVDEEEASALLDTLLHDDALARVTHQYGQNALVREGTAELSTVVAAMAALGLSAPHVRVDLSIARGLDYYTGTVYETFIKGKRVLGSISSGGRYDSLTANLGGKQFPGVGMTLGLSRLMAAIAGRKDDPSAALPDDGVLVTVQDDQVRDEYLAITAELREAGVRSECMLAGKSLAKQLQYAAQKKYRYVIIANKDEIDRGVVQLKDLVTHEQRELVRADLVSTLGV